MIAHATGGLLPRRFTLTPYEYVAVYSLLHFPSRYRGHPLDGTVSYSSPDFPLEFIVQAITCVPNRIIVKNPLERAS